MYLDEHGFAPSLPVSYSWLMPGKRGRIPYENPEGRRGNVLATLDTASSVPSLHWIGNQGTFRGVHLMRCFDEWLDQPQIDVRPLVVVLDNAVGHQSPILREALPALEARGLRPFSLPPASLDATPYPARLSSHQAYPAARTPRHFPGRRHDAFSCAFAEYEQKLLANAPHQPGLSASFNTERPLRGAPGRSFAAALATGHGSGFGTRCKESRDVLRDWRRKIELATELRIR